MIEYDEIVIKTLNLSGGALDKQTGIVKWVLELAPGEKATKTLAYSSIHPENKNVVFVEE